MDNEIWEDVVGYEGYYEVSNLGNIRGLDREVIGNFGVPRKVHGKDLNRDF